MLQKSAVFCLFILSFFLPPAGARAQTDAEIKAKADELAAKYMAQKGVGLIIGVVKGGQDLVYSYGETRRGGGRAPDPRDIFQIGSISKSYTGTLLALYVQRGIVRYDDPLQKFMPPGVRVPNYNGREITLLDLALHTSGLPRLIPNAVYPTNMPQIFQFLNNHQLRYAPGEKYVYSNLGYGLLGFALARARNSGNWQTIVRRDIGVPLGLSDTTVDLTPEQTARRIVGYGNDGRPAEHTAAGFPALNAGGALYSTLEDSFKFLRFNMGLTRTPLNSILPEIQKPRFQTAQPHQKTGLGWNIREGANPIISKQGTVGGFVCFMIFDKNRQVGVIAFSNARRLVPDPLAREMLGFLIKEKLADQADDGGADEN